MVAIEGARRNIVEPIVVNAGQPIGALGVRPDPGLERRLDLLQLLPRCFGIDDIEDASFPGLILDRVEDMGDAAVEGVGEEFARMPAIRALFRGARRQPAELARLDRP